MACDTRYVVLRCVSYVSLLMLITFLCVIRGSCIWSVRAATANIDRGHNVFEEQFDEEKNEVVAVVVVVVAFDGMV